MNDIFLLSKIFIKKRLNLLTKEDKRLLSNLKKEYSFYKSLKTKTLLKRTKNYSLIDSNAAWQKVSEKIDQKPTILAFIPRKNWVMYAAASITILFIASLFVFQQVDFNQTPQVSTSQPVIPKGSSKAVLILNNGEEVILNPEAGYTSANSTSNGEDIVYTAGGAKDNEPTKFNTLAVPRGGQFHIKLSDGSEVWLNSDSKIKYPVQFSKDKTREVELLYGEAYLAVSPSEENNGNGFHVKTNQQTVQVLGTEFNIKAYREEPVIATTLVEGKINLNLAGDTFLLAPSEQLSFNKTTKETQLNTINVYDAISWKKGVFSFKGDELKHIMTIISRWYDVDVVFENKELENIRFTGAFSKEQNLEQLLQIIKETNFINAYEIKERQITIK
ncbi:FecR family protein [Zunongwangia atlantica]|uniref:Anti-FecI sigma factor FecR n=1 Tax=Zunongwangia atlantica 22II14-10F7 TaxID=1185767 RepID=A0A1Y1T1Z5_9FLAO|nr:FecR family protein [Zunongwangia atlantica]ORL45058.1 anti-FecI sigma factor FecR [Zunongwangia atlantica 22II14-10F7]